MPYIGKQPTVGNFQVCDAISVVNGQAAYTMQVGSANVTPETAFHMLVSLNGVLQKPGSSFTISGSTITFASNLATGDVIDFIILLGDVLNIGAPSDDTVATASIQANAVTGAKLNTDVISAQTALTSAPADTDELLISDAGTIKRIDVSLVGGKNTPAFQATLSSDFQFSNTTATKVTFNTETFDTDSAYDNSSNYRFTPQTAGKYLVYAFLKHNPTSGNNLDTANTYLYKNGSIEANFDFIEGDKVNVMTTGGFKVVDMNGSSDYVECYVYQNTDGTPQIESRYQSWFGAYKLVGV